ncbi:glycoside hydrolase family 3 N-terminal domain-containing protein [Flavobacterium selenitireducens]|uniref:glycoside hydrolase family 3 N-terminal domain-containing protein n=1 Tax=Flavobacterium selenitireducens TaxID=2722704 RepID=UPI00168AB378|nr:glycoside hydrolase family 3 N-terminal domain-containing protein [Flavobacterium selenitireducens]MBD3580963.1 serine hydrolase [Flavobacterium selenitireducens]
MRFYLFAILVGMQFANAQFAKTPVQRVREEVWVDSIYKKMSLEEKIGQLFMVAAYSNKDSAHFNSISRLIKNQHIGGVIFFQGGPGRQAKLTNRYQSESKVPLFVGIDAEWGLAMRLDSVMRFPWNMTLGAVQDLALIEKVGESYARQAKRMGIHFNFAPVLDINTNPKNPIIGTRSFGEDKVRVADRASAMMRGIQRHGVLATGKHFPGHGDTETDSHYALPMVNFSKERIQDVELFPYKRLFNEGLASVMVAHLNVPAYETRENYPSSISYPIVTQLLQNEMGFGGLIFTDALNMKGAANFKQPGDIDLEALLAGNDILLFPENVPKALDKICVAIQDTMLSESRLEHSVKKILRYKYKVNLDMYMPIEMKNVYEGVNPKEDAALQYTLYENAVTVIRNEQEALPIRDLANEKIAYVKLGEDGNAPFVSTLKKYTEVTEIADDSIHLMLEKLKPFSTVIVGYHKSDGAWRNHDFKPEELAKLDSISKYNKVILDVFAKPYALLPVSDYSKFKAVVVSYQNSEVAQVVSAELLFGAISAKGKLPVSIGSNFKVGDGLTTQTTDVLGFTAPENVGMSSAKLSNIDMLAYKAINAKMTPGIQVLVARKGKVVYQKSFGFHTYEARTPVGNSDIYDVASLTKIVSTLPNVMQQYDKGKITFESKLGDLLPVFKHSDKKNIRIKELLSHYARLQAWEPFYKATLDSAKQPSPTYYRKMYDPMFTRQVAENLYIRNDYHDSVMKFIANSKLLPKREYKYSDFAFIIMKEYLEKSTNTTLDVLSEANIFKPLGMSSTMYNPLRRFDMSAIPPTEDDKYFRYQVVQGYVHDMEAAMEGGVAGHAGIFSNAMDVAKIMQMYLWKGHYAGHQFFSPKTFDEFNTCHFCKDGNRRGIGFDKPQLPGQAGPTCNCVSQKSFGHTGFTGTMAWADPESETIFIFLSNRTFPDSNVNALSKANIREDMQKVIQESILK